MLYRSSKQNSETEVLVIIYSTYTVYSTIHFEILNTRLSKEVSVKLRA